MMCYDVRAGKGGRVYIKYYDVGVEGGHPPAGSVSTITNVVDSTSRSEPSVKPLDGAVGGWVYQCTRKGGWIVC